VAARENAGEARFSLRGKPGLHETRGYCQDCRVEIAASDSFIPVIQLAITPVIMLSGVGALMLTLTNRLGRVVDRTRGLAGQMQLASLADRPHFESQLTILWRRARLIRLAVTYAGLSMLLSCVLVMAIFIDAIRDTFGLELVVLFAASIVCLIFALMAFLRDVWMSLWALRLELDKAHERTAP
jgi:hypothetical protein